MQQVPVLVKGEDGEPVHHGIVERSYDKLRPINQMFVRFKQEDRVCVCGPAVCTFAIHYITCVAIRVYLLQSPSIH